ncbi:MAG: sulfotransferase family protein [Gammaproteobacteria bacterium]|nr:MAG: sulfotransferase family protein [Gammaproteobacteria bacterium]
MSGRIIAMWSGPRNISTAMMRAWENRADTEVVDEPFYAHYLAATGIDHPMREAIIANGETRLAPVIDRLTTKPDSGIFYQKHITTHWLPNFPTDWLAGIDHVFLIRAPASVIASYDAKREAPTLEDLGFAQQSALFDRVSKMQGRPPLVIDSQRFLADPERQLRLVCESLDVPFDPAMLAWRAGSRESDGIWAEHWYDAVNRSTGFAAAREPVAAATLPPRLQPLLEQCRPHHERLAALAIR